MEDSRMKQRTPLSLEVRSKAPIRMFFHGIVPLLLTLPYLSHAEEAEALRSAVANILERNGFAISRQNQADSNPPAASTMVDSAISSHNMTPMMDEVADTTPEPASRAVTGLIVVFADEGVKALSRDNLPPPVELIDALESAAGVPLTFKRAMSLGGFVFSFETALSQQELEPILAGLRQLGDIERVAADTSGAVSLRPSDEYFSYQWALHPPGWYFPALGRTITGIDAIGAWDITTGSENTVVAVLDTGLSDPSPIDSSRTLPGYDFISDPEMARDGNGRDNDPTDMGDHRLQDECKYFPEPSRSTWHGSRVSSVIAASGNSGVGMAGIDWHAGLLPVRVLGKCGGSTSDIIDGMLWAAGFSVPGVPDNPYPANVINMSLSSKDEIECAETFYPGAIRQITAKGVLIIVAAGNQEAEANRFAPGNCDNVMTVAATNHIGEKAYYSNWSSENAIFLSAPGGELTEHNSSISGVMTVGDTGEEDPEGQLAYYYSQGTSFAAPHVSGIASLALGLDPYQHPQVIADAMALTAQPFAAGSDCDQMFLRCGYGIVDARTTLEAVEVLKSYKVVGEFYHEGLDHYFRTGNWDEIDLVLQGQFGAWQPTSDLFLSWRDATDGALPVCRFYGTPGIGPNSHFYTVDPEECEKVKRDPGWTYEGVPFYSKMHNDGSCPADTTPVYRYYNQGWKNNDANHRFATHLDDQEAMEAAGWVLEGVAMCAPG